ncbi:MAG TPA: HEAT repeat domain-containing protein [Planctomycetota bacterium]|nr:HEAT repeat domain-containing protein [Planctomycetota bacterium]
MTQWQYWWALNQAPYLMLKSHVHSGGDVLTDSDGYLLGRGPKGNLREGLRVTPATIRTVIIPQLLEALKSETSDDIQSSCMIALAKIGDPDGGEGISELEREVLREISKRLISPSQELSETAAVALGIAGNRESIEVLVALLENDAKKLRSLDIPQIDDVSVRTRAFAAYGLGLIGYRAPEYDRLVINAALRRLLEGEGRSMAHRDVPVACLTSMGLTALPIDDRDLAFERMDRQRAEGVLGSRQDQLRFLLDYYADESNNPLTRAQAPTAMARLLRGDEVPEEFPPRTIAAKALMQSIAEGSKADSMMQLSCILALGLIGDCDEDPVDTSIRATLMGVKEKLADQQARRFALIALAQVAGHPGRGEGDSMHGVNTRETQRNARSFITNELNSRTSTRAWAGLALAVLERSLDDARREFSNDSKLALRTCLGEARSPDDLGAFSIACGIVRDAGAKDLLLDHLDTVRDVEARGFTAVALGLLNDKTAISSIKELAKRSKFQPELLRNAAIALGLLDDKQLVPELIDMLAAATSLSSQAAISKALGTIGDSRSVEALLRLLHNTEATELARAFGAVALGIVADKEDLPWNAKIGVGSNYRANTSSLTDGRGGILDIL